MLKTKNNGFSPRQINKASLNAFFNICQKWGISSKDQQTLLGLAQSSTYYNWKASREGVLPKDTLERISYLLGTYKALHIIFTDKNQANEWIKKPNKAFCGASALDVMLGGKVVDIARVRSYLDAQRGY